MRKMDLAPGLSRFQPVALQRMSLLASQWMFLMAGAEKRRWELGVDTLREVETFTPNLKPRTLPGYLAHKKQPSPPRTTI